MPHIVASHLDLHCLLTSHKIMGRSSKKTRANWTWCWFCDILVVLGVLFSVADGSQTQNKAQ